MGLYTFLFSFLSFFFFLYYLRFFVVLGGCILIGFELFGLSVNWIIHSDFIMFVLLL